MPGTFSTAVINQQSTTYTVDPDLKMLITVDETFDNDHRVVSKRDSHSGRFTFSAADAGQHRICFTPETNAASSGWFSDAKGAVKVTLDMTIGETSKIETEDKDKMQDIVQKVKDLNGRLQDIRREQVFQRVRPAFALPPPPGALMESTDDCRNVRPNSVTSLRRLTPVSFAGPSSSWLCSPPRAPGSSRTCGRSSSSRS
jgi:hypothetical protein